MAAIRSFRRGLKCVHTRAYARIGKIGKVAGIGNPLPKKAKLEKKQDGKLILVTPSGEGKGKDSKE